MIILGIKGLVPPKAESAIDLFLSVDTMMLSMKMMLNDENSIRSKDLISHLTDNCKNCDICC